MFFPFECMNSIWPNFLLIQTNYKISKSAFIFKFLWICPIRRIILWLQSFFSENYSPDPLLFSENYFSDLWIRKIFFQIRISFYRFNLVSEEKKEKKRESAISDFCKFFFSLIVNYLIFKFIVEMFIELLFLKL